jgi:hypothetical protein
MQNGQHSQRKLLIWKGYERLLSDQNQATSNNVIALIVINHRIIGNADYDNGMIYYGPIILALIVLPLVLFSIKSLKR